MKYRTPKAPEAMTRDELADFVGIPPDLVDWAPSTEGEAALTEGLEVIARGATPGTTEWAVARGALFNYRMSRIREAVQRAIQSNEEPSFVGATFGGISRDASPVWPSDPIERLYQRARDGMRGATPPDTAP